MSNFTTLIVNMVNKENLWAPQGGPIILAQVYLNVIFYFIMIVIFVTIIMQYGVL